MVIGGATEKGLMKGAENKEIGKGIYIYILVRRGGEDFFDGQVGQMVEG